MISIECQVSLLMNWDEALDHLCDNLFSLLPSAGREMSSSLRATGWRPSVTDWGGGMSASCKRGSSCSLTWAMDGHIVCCAIISSCQSPATSEIVKRFWLHVWLMSEARSRPLPLLCFTIQWWTESRTAGAFAKTSATVSLMKMFVWWIYVVVSWPVCTGLHSCVCREFMMLL